MVLSVKIAKCNILHTQPITKPFLTFDKKKSMSKSGIPDMIVLLVIDPLNFRQLKPNGSTYFSTVMHFLLFKNILRTYITYNLFPVIIKIYFELFFFLNICLHLQEKILKLEVEI